MPGLPLLSKPVALRFAKAGWNELHCPVHYKQHLRWFQVINNFTLGRTEQSTGDFHSSILDAAQLKSCFNSSRLSGLKMEREALVNIMVP